MPAGELFNRCHRALGFTLIELMVALAILAIVVAVAIPSYTNFVINSNRSEAKVILNSTAQALERCYTRYSDYSDPNCPASDSANFPIESEGDWYQMDFSDQTIGTDTYTLTAVPQGSQATRDTECKNFELTHTGARNVTGSASVDDCW